MSFISFVSGNKKASRLFHNEYGCSKVTIYDTIMSTLSRSHQKNRKTIAVTEANFLVSSSVPAILASDTVLRSTIKSGRNHFFGSTHERRAFRKSSRYTKFHILNLIGQ